MSRNGRQDTSRLVDPFVQHITLEVLDSIRESRKEASKNEPDWSRREQDRTIT